VAFGTAEAPLFAIREAQWPQNAAPQPLMSRDVVAFSAGPRDAYLCLRHGASDRLVVFRLVRDRARLEPVGSPPEAAPNVLCAAFGWVGDEPVLHCVTRLGTAADGEQKLHRFRWVAARPDGTQVFQREFELRSRTDRLGLSALGGDSAGNLYLTKSDWVPDAEGRYWFRDVRTSVVVVREPDGAVADQPADALEKMAKDAGVPAWTDRYYLRVSAAGHLLVGFMCEDAFRLVRFTRETDGG
jgi:hypothetical protein